MTSLHSPRWYRVAELKPKLATPLQLRRQRVRGQTWYLLRRVGGGRALRLNDAAYAVAARLDGQRSVAELWQALLADEQAEPATQDEVIDVLAQLREAGLLQLDRAADFELLLPHLDRVARPAGRNNLLAWRVPLLDPSPLLDRLAPLQPLLFSRGALLLWALAMAALLSLALQHAPALWAHGATWLATPRFALLAALLVVPIKLLHELAHGLAVRRWGGAVREAGVTFMLGMPMPYVDASASADFVQRRHRVAVGAAGIMAELALAALALPLWLWLADGPVRDAAFVTLVLAGVSTLLFNANPLQRLDGYYIATDLLELPNLATRSRRWWLQWLRRRALAVDGAEPMPVAPGEAPWLAAYAPLSWAVSLGIAALAVAWLGQLSLSLGLACAALLGWQIGLRPPLRLLTQLQRDALAQAVPRRRWRRLALGGGAVLALALLLPLPQSLRVQGVVWPPEQAQLRSDEDGIVERVAVRDGQPVQAGELLLQLTSPSLQAQRARQSARVAVLETALFQSVPDALAAPDAARAGDARAELAAAQAELDRLDERAAALAVRAPSAGRLALPQAADLTGQFLRRGSLLGQVLDAAPPTVRVALPQARADELRASAQAVSVRLAGAPGTPRAAHVVRASGGAVLQLPSAALSDRHGGDVQTDPADPEHLKPLQPVVLVDVQLDAAADKAAGGRIGERAWVRFDAGHAPLALQLARVVERQLLRRFNPQF